MNVIDSSGWLEYFSDSPEADNFSHLLQYPEKLVVPAICIYEVAKKLLQEFTVDQALVYIAQMRRGLVVDVTDNIALNAARISLEHKLPMADSIIYATALEYNATVWTQDIDFKNLPGVKYFPKTRK